MPSACVSAEHAIASSGFKILVNWRRTHIFDCLAEAYKHKNIFPLSMLLPAHFNFPPCAFYLSALLVNSLVYFEV